MSVDRMEGMETRTRRLRPLLAGEWQGEIVLDPREREQFQGQVPCSIAATSSRSWPVRSELRALLDPDVDAGYAV